MLKSSYDTTDQPNVEFLVVRSFTTVKMRILGDGGSQNSRFLTNFCRHTSSNQGIERKALMIDNPDKKVLWSAFQDATFVKISGKSEHFYFSVDQIWDSRILESRAQNYVDQKMLRSCWKFHKSCVLQRRSQNLFIGIAYFYRFSSYGPFTGCMFTQTGRKLASPAPEIPFLLGSEAPDHPKLNVRLVSCTIRCS